MSKYLFKLKVTQQADTFPVKTLVLLNEAKKNMRTWIRQTFKGRLLDSSYMSAVSFTTEIEVSRTGTVEVISL